MVLKYVAQTKKLTVMSVKHHVKMLECYMRDSARIPANALMFIDLFVVRMVKFIVMNVK